MNRDHRCTDDDLHRFVDGELNSETRRRVQDQLDAHPPLAARAQAYRTVDQAVREAFDEVEPPPARLPNASKSVKRSAVAAAALLLPGVFLAGWLAHALFGGTEDQTPLAGGIKLPAQDEKQLKTLFHIDGGGRSEMAGLLDRAEAILTAYADRDPNVEVVANAAGINLLRADTSAFTARVREMMDKYENLTFVACANTINRLREQGVKVRLIERTQAGDTAIDRVVDRLRAGWTYVKI